MKKNRMEELMANLVEHLEECCPTKEETNYVLENSIGFTREELEELGFGYLYETDEDEEGEEKIEIILLCDRKTVFERPFDYIEKDGAEFPILDLKGKGTIRVQLGYGTFDNVLEKGEGFYFDICFVNKDEEVDDVLQTYWVEDGETLDEVLANILDMFH